MTSSLTYTAENEIDTEALGASLAEHLPEGSVVALCGTLGSGKTRLVQALAEASGVDRRAVVSPTFVLVQQYHGRRTIYHVDAYRLRDDDEFLELGPEERFHSGAITLIEWADRVTRCLPEERVEIQIEVIGPTQRRFKITARGKPYVTFIERMKSWATS